VTGRGDTQADSGSDSRVAYILGVPSADDLERERPQMGEPGAWPDYDHPRVLGAVY
jgi:hypothetical protein